MSQIAHVRYCTFLSLLVLVLPSSTGTSTYWSSMAQLKPNIPVPTRHATRASVRPVVFPSTGSTSRNTASPPSHHKAFLYPPSPQLIHLFLVVNQHHPTSSKHLRFNPHPQHQALPHSVCLPGTPLIPLSFALAGAAIPSSFLHQWRREQSAHVRQPLLHQLRQCC